MKATDTKTSAAQSAKKTAPFFRKGADKGFFKPAQAVVQAKLTVGEPGDAFEKEAEQMADKVVQRKPIFESEGVGAEGIQRKSEVETEGFASHSVESGIASSKGSGSPLPEAIKSQMETGFGADFSAVRIHDNSSAQQMSKELNAQAFTHGTDIYFDSGKYNPQSREGEHLLAHELTHVVQQTGTVQRAPAAAPRAGRTARANRLTPGRATIDEVTDKMPFAGGKVLREGGNTVIEINNISVKDNVDKAFFQEIDAKLPLPMPAPGDRKKIKTDQIGIWTKMVEAKVKEKVKSHIEKINRRQPIADKLKPENLYMLRVPKSTGFSTIVGNYDSLVEECIIPKWSIRGKGMSFQVEHIMDFQIAGKLADDPRNLMLLNAERNRELGGDILRLIKLKIQAVLNHYNQFIPKGTLEEKAHLAQQRAKEDYAIETASLEKIRNNFAQEEAILEGYMIDSRQDKLNPLREGNIEITAFGKAKRGEFLLQSREGGPFIVLPYKADHLQVGSFILFLNGSEAKGIKSITAVMDMADDVLHEDNPIREFPVTPLPGKTKMYKAEGFGNEMSRLKINYLSLAEFKNPTLDGELNLHANGMVKTPTPRFLKGPIDIAIHGRELSFDTIFRADDLGNVGPIRVDYADLALGLALHQGFKVDGGVSFSIPKVGRGHVEGSRNGKGFIMKGDFDFDAKTFDKGNITVSYDSTKDLPNQHPWTFDGTLMIGRKVKGIDSATIRVGSADGQLTFNGSANLNVPGVKSATINGSYRNGQDFQLALGAIFDFKNKFIADPKIDVKLAAGGATGAGGAGDNPNSGWRLAANGSMTLKVPKLGDVPIAVNYDQGEFDASAAVNDIKVGEHVKGKLTVGITNKPVDDATGVPAGGKGGGKDLRLYGHGQVTVVFNEHLQSTVGVRLTPDGKVLVNGNVSLNKQPLLPRKDLYSGKYPIFKLDSPEIPVFSIGVGDVYIKVGGEGDAMYRIGVPLISADVNLKDVDIFDPASMKIQASITPEISAEAGIDLSAFFAFGARVAVLKAEGRVTGTVGLHADATLHPSLVLSWSPTDGLGFVSEGVDLTAAIKGKVDLKGSVAVLLDFYFTSVNVWDKSWDLANIDLGELGNIDLHFPLNFGKNGLPTEPNQLLPKTPFNKQEAAQQWLLNKPGGAEKKEQGKSDAEIQKEVEAGIQFLPAIGPRNPKYQQLLGRAYYYDLLKQTMPIDLEFYRKTWRDVEQEEYANFRLGLLKPASEAVSKEVQIDQFEMDHVMVDPWQIAALRVEVFKLENRK